MEADKSESACSSEQRCQAQDLACGKSAILL